MMTVKILLLIFHINVVCIWGKKHQHYKINFVNEHEVDFDHLESPRWDPNTKSLLFVDALKQNIHRLDLINRKLHTKHIEYGQVNVVSTVKGSRRLLVAARAALYLLDWTRAGDSALRLLVSLEHGLPDNLINEGKADALGRFWAGTKGPQKGDVVTPDMAAFYSVEQETLSSPREHLRPVSISNGLTWSLNNSVLYYIDSRTKKIEAFDFDLQKGEINARRTIVDITDYGYENGIPDGMTIDDKGKLWVAIMFSGTVLQIDPDNRNVIDEYKFPTNRTTSLSWGGPGLKHLFVTTSRDSTKEGDSAVIYYLPHTGSRGVPENSFRFDNADDY